MYALVCLGFCGHAVMNRAGDRAETHYFRSDRLFSVNDKWYFSTREHLDQGPYTTRNEAEIEMIAYAKIFKKHQQKAS